MKAKTILVFTILIYTGNLRGFNPFCFSQECKVKSDTRTIEAQCVFRLSAPQGWHWDESSYSEYVRRPVFYKDNDPNKNELQLYIAIRNQKVKNDSELNDYIHNQSKLARQNDSTIIVQDAESILTKDKIISPVHCLYSLKDTTYRSIAYLRCEEAILEIILFSRTKEYYDQSILAFKDLVKSFYFVKIIGRQY